MTKEFKGGNGRLLVKTLDASEDPVAMLDRRGQIVFVNAAFCRAAGAEATQLVGKLCQWDLAADGEPYGALLNALAPPALTRDGRLMIRDLPVSPFARDALDHQQTQAPASTQSIGQLFLPILDDDQLVHMMIVVFANWDKLQKQRPERDSADMQAAHGTYERTIVDVRSRWDNVDHLVPLLGESPAIELAMKRVQLSVRQACSVLICGPRFVGKLHIAQGIFQSRLKLADAPPSSGQCFTVDAAVLDEKLFEAMLEVFVGRMRTGEQAGSQQLVVDHLDRMNDSLLGKLLRFVERHVGECTLVGLSEESSSELARRGPSWRRLISRLADIEITLPPLRQRREDIPVLAQQLLAEHCRESERALLTFSPSALDLLIGNPWPENLRQLKAAVEKSVDQAMLTSVIEDQHLPVEIRTFPSSIQNADSGELAKFSLDELLEEFERTVLKRALNLSPRNRAQVARWLGISRPRLLRRIGQLGLESSPQSERVDKDAEP